MVSLEDLQQHIISEFYQITSQTLQNVPQSFIEVDDQHSKRLLR